MPSLGRGEGHHDNLRPEPGQHAAVLLQVRLLLR